MKSKKIIYLILFMFCAVYISDIHAQEGEVKSNLLAVDFFGTHLNSFDELIFVKNPNDGIKDETFKENRISDSEDNKVHIPFGERNNKNLTYAITSLLGENISQIPLTSLENSLTGLLSGVYISPNSVGPGLDSYSILIRGRTSYNDNQSPLILVDGIERDISNLDIQEIESISVLKDAASAAWYGVRGANGVILVNTKQGSEGRTNITFDIIGGAQIPQNYTNTLDSHTYANLYNEALSNDGRSHRYSSEELNRYQDQSDPFGYPNNDFVDRFLKDTAPIQRYVTTVSGGTSNARYFTSLSYADQSGLFSESSSTDYDSNARYKSYSFRSNLDVDVFTDLTVSLNIGGSRMERVSPGESTGGDGINNFLNSIFLTPPNAYSLINEDGTYGGTSLFQNNPLALLQHDGYSSENIRTIFSSAKADYNLHSVLDGLSISGMYSYDISGYYTRGQNQNYEVFEYNPETNSYSQFGNRTELSFRNANFSDPYRNSEFWLGFDYDRTFSNHGINGSLRYNYASTLNPVLSSFAFERNSISSRVSYNFNQQYLLDVVLTYADNLRFPPNQRTGLFPAVSTGWVVSEEEFINDINFINYLKLRASYGIAGSDQLYGVRLYNWKPLYGPGFPGYNFGSGFSSTGSGLGELPLANEDLTFEKSHKFNAGFDIQMFDHSLAITGDYFIDKRTDIITPFYLPGSIGQSMVHGNFGETRSHGIETAINYNVQIERVTMHLFGNLTYATSEIDKMREVPGAFSHQFQAGFPVGNFGLMYRSDGFFESQSEIDNAPQQLLASTVRPGDIRYVDINGDGVINEDDRVMTDYSHIPKAYYAFGAAFEFAGFDFSALFTGVQGRSVDIRGAVLSGNANTGYINEFSVDRWTNETSSNAMWPRLAIDNRDNNIASSTFWIHSGDYLQLKNIELGYSLPQHILERFNVSSIRFYINGNNLVTFSSLKDLNINPLLVNAGRSGNYPYLATFTGGISIDFNL